MVFAYAYDSDRRPAGGFVPGRLIDPTMIRLSGLPASMAMVPLSKCVHGNWVSGPADFTGMYTPDDLVRELRSLYDDVFPKMELDGATVGHFAVHNVRSTGGARSPEDVHNGFFGDSAVAVDLTEDGTFVITNGAHRVWVARRLGMTHLPARVSYL